MPSNFQDFLFTKDLVDFDLKRQKQADEIAEAIEEENKKKSRNALIATVLGSLINPAAGIAAGIGARRITDAAIDTESMRVTASKYTPSETEDINKQFKDIQESISRGDIGQDLQLAIGTLLLGGLSKNIQKMGALGGLKETAFQPGFASKALDTGFGDKLFPNLFKPWTFGGG